MQRRYYRQIVIRYVSVPVQEDDADAEIDYIFQCLGLGDERDDVGRIVFRALVRAGKKGTGISSRDIMQLSEVSQAAVIYHLNLFQRSGLVSKDGRMYYLRGRTLEQTLDEIEGDMHRKFEHLKEIARKVERV
jgi:predicted transcriptional regulator